MIRVYILTETDLIRPKRDTRRQKAVFKPREMWRIIGSFPEIQNISFILSLEVINNISPPHHNKSSFLTHSAGVEVVRGGYLLSSDAPHVLLRHASLWQLDYRFNWFSLRISTDVYVTSIEKSAGNVNVNNRLRLNSNLKQVSKIPFQSEVDLTRSLNWI